jgi:acetyl esterase/lipase
MEMKNYLKSIFSWLIIALIVMSNLKNQAANSVNGPVTRTWTNVTYASASTRNVLDIYLPPTGDGPFPVVIWIHGGAFKMGSKDNPQSKSALNNAGFAVVSINYRLSSEAIWPAQLDDLKAVVKFLRTNASTYFLNTDKIGSWGASAGGHLSAMMGIALARDPETRIQACVDWFGPVDFYNMDADIALSGVARCTGANGDANSPESALIGVQVSTHKAESDNASPVVKATLLDASVNVPPFLIMHGGKDCNIGAKQSERLNEAINTKYGTTKSTYVFLANGTHGGGDFTLASTEKTVIDFFTSKLLTVTASPVIQENELLVYPNPATNVVFIRQNTSSEPVTHFEISDINGRLVKSGPVSGNSIDINGLHGFYFLRLKTANKTIKTERITVY